MKYLILIKAPVGVSPQELEELRQGGQDLVEKLGVHRYVVIVSTADIDIKVYPYWLYKIKALWNRFIIKSKQKEVSNEGQTKTSTT